MCQYFWKPAGITIDEEKLRNSVINNPHGWGLLYRDKPKGKGPWPFTYMECEDPTKDTDPDEIIKLLNETLKDKEVYIHLRWVTAGKRTKDNIHPFEIISEGDYQLFLMHNGTLTDFKPKAGSDDSDTKIFVEKVMLPLAFNLEDPFSWDTWQDINTIIHKLIGGWSRIMLISSAEEVPILFNYDNHHFEYEEYVDKDGKKKKKPLWISANDYSFDPDHRKPKSKAVTSSYYYSYPSGQSNTYSSYVRVSDWTTDYVTVSGERIKYRRAFVYSYKRAQEVIKTLPDNKYEFDFFEIGPNESPVLAIQDYIKERLKDSADSHNMLNEPYFLIEDYDFNDGQYHPGGKHGKTISVFC